MLLPIPLTVREGNAFIFLKNSIINKETTCHKGNEVINV